MEVERASLREQLLRAAAAELQRGPSRRDVDDRAVELADRGMEVTDDLGPGQGRAEDEPLESEDRSTTWEADRAARLITTALLTALVTALLCTLPIARKLPLARETSELRWTRRSAFGAEAGSRAVGGNHVGR